MQRCSLNKSLVQWAAASGAGNFDVATMERLTAAFGNLAAIAIQAAHDAAGKELTPESVMALMPVSTPLRPPSKSKKSGGKGSGTHGDPSGRKSA